MSSAALTASFGVVTPRWHFDTNPARLPQWPRVSSRLVHLFESNDTPLDSEIPDICQNISDNQARVDALNAQIDMLRPVRPALMEALIAERDEGEELVLKLATVVSPVRRVPPEIMYGIFALTLPHTRRLVILSDNDTSSVSPLLHIPWGQMTHYRAKYRPERPQLEILEAASNLLECDLGFIGEPYGIPADNIITLPHLRRLSIPFLVSSTAPSVLTTFMLEICPSADLLVRVVGGLPSLEHLLVEALHW
ncbi:hypothetical protein C8R44DRAFT_978220 [Mycena epipterygia]|nr:hypothetical protein C8R44DRAFT_978220 [Mycena epipterygia]